MKSKEEIRRRLIEIEDDARLHYPPANVNVNAPLALIQVDLAARSNALRWVLDLAPFKRGQKFRYSSERGRFAARAKARYTRATKGQQ